MPTRPLLLALALCVPALAAAQDTPPVPAVGVEPLVTGTEPAPLKKTIVVPVPTAPVTTPAPAQGQPSEPGAAPMVVPLPSQEQPAPEQPFIPSPPPQPPVIAAPAAPIDPPPPAYAPDTAQVRAEEVQNSGPTLDGHPREGAFLAGPGSMTFVLHHTLMLGLGGLATQVTWNGSNLELKQREALLAGTLVGAGLGFGFSAWWQFNHWIDQPVATYSLVNSVVGGMFLGGLMHLMAPNDPTLITWSALIGAETGAWLTTILGGGDMPLNHGVFIASGAGWGLAYAALILGIIGSSGTSVGSAGALNTLLLAPGIGAGALALATMRYNPTTSQVLRADIFGAGVGAAVLLLSGLVLGNFTIPTPYVLSLLSATGAIAAVSILWEESAERPALYRRRDLDRPYRNVWW